MMRIAYVCADPGIPVFGRKRGEVRVKGCSIHVQEMIRALIHLGARVELFATCAEGEPPSDLRGVPVHPLPPVAGVELAGRERAALAANNGLRAALQRAGPFDLVYERYSLWSFAGMRYARESGIPGLLEVNAPLIEEQAEHRGLVDRPAAERVMSRAFADATRLIAVSEEVAAYLGRQVCTSGRVLVVPNGVDPGRFRPGLPASLPGGPGSFTVGFVGALKPWHGLLNLTEAFARLRDREPSARLLIVGDGPEGRRTAEDLSARGLGGAAHLTGPVEPNSIPGLLASMDVAVAPYTALRDFYFSPLKVYEYLAAGLPVVASRVGQLDGLIEHGVNGLLCPPDEPAALAEALDALRIDRGLRRRLGEAARATVLRGHTWEAAARRVLDSAGVAPAPSTPAGAGGAR
jgi:glycosyltransferase involved in cell wall biosynthesis